LIPLRPDVIVVSSTLGAVEAKKATTSIPVIFIGVTDPVGERLVSSLARPGGNITGLARTAGEGLTPKTVQALREIVPGYTHGHLESRASMGAPQASDGRSGGLRITSLPVGARPR
jgi:hypothetical protein